MNPASDLTDWSGVPFPQRAPLQGGYTRLEPLDPDRHVDALYQAASAEGAQERFRYLPDRPPVDRADLQDWIRRAVETSDPMFFAVIDRATGRAEGRQALMRIDTANGVAEIGNIMWGPAMTRTRIATEALYLFADHIFGLGYRRFEWKCDDLNVPSKRAAQRFGFTFEGVFRQDRVVKGLNRNTAWFSIIDSEWPRLREGYRRWLAPDNFDADGRQREKLSF